MDLLILTFDLEFLLLRTGIVGPLVFGTPGDYDYTRHLYAINIRHRVIYIDGQMIM
jgi:hypothetical protein